jgi:hypothetical protein
VKEAQVCTEIVNSLKEQGAWAWKIPDASPMLRAQQRYIPARAFDIIAIYKGMPLAIEVKLIRTGGGLSSDRITQFERDSLLAAAEAGCRSFLAIAYAYKPGKKALAKGAPKWVRELWMVDIETWQVVAARAFLTGKKTVPRAEILNVGESIPWAKHGLWGIDAFLDMQTIEHEMRWTLT